MPALFRYLFNHFLFSFLKVLGVFVGLFFLLDGTEQIRRFADSVNVHWYTLAHLLSLRMPEFLIQFLPPMTLLATLTAMSQLARRSEIIAMRASGISIYRILIPFLIAGFWIAVGQAIIQDQVLPKTRHGEDQLVAYIKDRPTQQSISKAGLWIRDGGRIIHAETVSADHGVLFDVMVLVFNDEHLLINRVDARKGVLENGKWSLVDGISYDLINPTKNQVFERADWNINLASEQLDRTAPKPQAMPLSQLWAYAERLEREGYDPQTYWVYFQRKLADPITTMAAILLAFPFSLRLHRLGGAYRSLLIGILSGFLMFSIVDLFTALGLGGRLPPTLAAWSPVACFASIGAYLLMHLEEVRR
ncbi:MAG: LPS export ABC transporter permease LptG [Magnetococcales bacterium]|nr:LPS export ABC transporter permease LptG [Magnetococcales bacterium]